MDVEAVSVPLKISGVDEPLSVQVLVPAFKTDDAPTVRVPATVTAPPEADVVVDVVAVPKLKLLNVQALVPPKLPLPSIWNVPEV